MATDRLRVVPENSHRGLPATAALLGVATGLVFAWSLYFAVMGGYLPPLVPLWMVLGAGVILAIAMTAVTQRWKTIALSGALFWMSAAFAGDVAGFIVHSRTDLHSTNVASMADWGLNLTVEMVICALIGVLLGLAAVAVTRTLAFRTVEQDGLLCWRCGYSTGSDRVTKCPECGTPVDLARFRWNWMHRVVATGQRFGLIACLVLFAAGAVAVGWIWVEGANSPVSRFVVRMRRFGPIEIQYVMVVGSSPLAAGEPSVGVRMPLDPANSLELVVLHVASSLDGTIMQLKIAQTPKVTATGSGSYSSSMNPVPSVVCNLNPTQAEIVMTAGVPQSLKDAMLNAAATVSWDGWSGVGAPPPNIGVDPTPHFPAE